MAQLSYSTATEERALVVSLSLAGGEDDMAMRLSELRELAMTEGARVVGEFSQSRRAPDMATYIGPGKVEDLKGELASTNAELVIFDDELSPTQQRNLTNALERRVLDRTQLILDIFAQRARTREGKLQVELAQLNYLLPRLSSLYTKFERQQGGIGGRGPGETKLESDRRRVKERIAQLGREIDEMREQRSQQRQMRDPTTRRVVLPHGGWSVLMTDTVGFIRNLPHHLVASFRATLEEVVQADFLIHVVDTAHPERERQMRAVLEVLAELGAENKPIITAFNKADLVKDAYELQTLIAATPNSCYLSATKRDGIPFLMDRMEATLQSLLATVTLILPYGRSDIVAQCYEMGRVHSVDYGSETITVHADIAKELAGRLERFTPGYVED